MNTEIIENVKMNIMKGLELFDKEAIRRGIEIWRPIEGYPNYSVSSKGNVMNVVTGTILKTTLSYACYNRVKLYNNGNSQNYVIHRLVANAYLTNPENKPCVDHMNNNTTDNNVRNLRWATIKENCQNRSIASNNTSGAKGISWHKQHQKWWVKINNEHKGYYNSLEEAKLARQLMSKEHHGEFQNVCEK